MPSSIQRQWGGSHSLVSARVQRLPTTRRPLTALIAPGLLVNDSAPQIFIERMSLRIHSRMQY